MERSGQLLDRVTTVFFNLLSAETTDFLDALAQKMSPILSEHTNNIMLNEGLFKRVKAVYDHHASDQFARLSPEQKMLLTNTYEGFVRNGALLSDIQKKQLRHISAELSVLSLQFSQNKLKDTNSFILHITDETELEGLPDSAIDLARQTAKERHMDGYVFTLQAPSYTPFLTYSSRRELREKMYRAYNTLCTHPGDTNNVDIVKKIVNLHRAKEQPTGICVPALFANDSVLSCDFEVHVQSFILQIMCSVL